MWVPAQGAGGLPGTVSVFSLPVPGRSGDTGALGSLETHTGLVVSQPPADVGSSVDAVVSQVSSEKLSQRPNLSQSHSK